MSSNRSDVTGGGGDGEVIDEEEDEPRFVHLQIKFQYQEDTVSYFKMKRTTQLNRLMKVYCEIQNLDFSKIVFFSDGLRLRPEHTPNEIDMIDGDQIDAFFGPL
ncbi:Small ubiquitin-related modifier 2 [Cardamine amara subsp. amara]|uniref:Small ubiquitin-related modifier 2 n=1 Tax=Cardamine amara subsp. amara TaxID=228776 RepID=A0ABD0ZWB5_CARAN